MLTRFACALLIATAALAVGGCATVPVSSDQKIEVTVQGAPSNWPSYLSCKASNSLGAWSFQAPGPVLVRRSPSPLHIQCEVPEGAAVVTDVSAGRSEEVRKGESTGAKVGGVVGVAAAAVTAPVVGPALAAVVVVGAVLRGREVGGVVQHVRTGGAVEYPSKVELRVELRKQEP